MQHAVFNFSTSTFCSDFSRRLFFIRLFCSRATATVQKTLPRKYQFHFRKLNRHIVRPPPSHNNWSAPQHQYFLHDWKLRADHWSCAGNVCIWLATETHDSVLGFRFARCNFTCRRLRWVKKPVARKAFPQQVSDAQLEMVCVLLIIFAYRNLGRLRHCCEKCGA